jgi:proline iminopeptidase
VRLDGVDLFVDDRGDEAAPPLLYVHGGPGQGSWDFMAAQGDRLAERIRVIGVDQRGVLRSGDLPPEPPLTVDVLLDDFEALRSSLAIDSWCVLGHSAGGHYALRYATAHPRSVTGVVFDCPCWDCDLTDRYRLPIVAERLEERGDEDAARECRRLAAKPGRLTADDETSTAMQALDSAYLDLFFRDAGSARAYEAWTASAGFDDETWARGRSHAPLLAEMYESQLDLLDGLVVPSMLVHGRHEVVAPPDVIDAYRQRVRDGEVHTFEGSGHFPYHEEPEPYADLIADFVLARAR